MWLANSMESKVRLHTGKVNPESLASIEVVKQARSVISQMHNETEVLERQIADLKRQLAYWHRKNPVVLGKLLFENGSLRMADKDCKVFIKDFVG